MTPQTQSLTPVADALVKQASRAIKAADSCLATWAEAFAKDPGYALRYSAAAMDAATKKPRWAEILQRAEHVQTEAVRTCGSINHDEDLVKEIQDDYRHAIFQAARQTSQSTNPMSNLMEREDLSCRVRILEEIGRF